MSEYQLLLPQMGESVAEATIIKWLKEEGDVVELDESIVEIATDKVDSDIPSPVAGILKKKLCKIDQVVKVGQALAILESMQEPQAEDENQFNGTQTDSTNLKNGEIDDAQSKYSRIEPEKEDKEVNNEEEFSQESLKEKKTTMFLSPLVKSIVEKENLSMQQLEEIKGTGINGRITKRDIIGYIEQKNNKSSKDKPIVAKQDNIKVDIESCKSDSSQISENIEVIEMDRMRKLIANHMVNSVKTSPHVTSFVEADVTKIVQWRNKKKNKFKDIYGENLTFTPIFIDAVIKAIKDFPIVNSSLDGDKILIKKSINIGMATALPNGNLIVPVIKNADQFNLIGLSKQVNNLSRRARENKLNPEDIQDGTYTITNVGTFGNLMGTPIINQPQVGILAIGSIRKVVAVIETDRGDLIGIRQKLFLSHSYDHRVIDGALGGSFVKRVADYLDKFDINLEI